jgi:hypothetical protein
MPSERETVADRYLRFGEMVWSLPDDDLEWRLRNGTPSRSDLLHAASILADYHALIYSPVRKSAAVLRALRSAVASPEVPDAR